MGGWSTEGAGLGLFGRCNRSQKRRTNPPAFLSLSLSLSFPLFLSFSFSLSLSLSLRLKQQPRGNAEHAVRCLCVRLPSIPVLSGPRRRLENLFPFRYSYRDDRELGRSDTRRLWFTCVLLGLSILDASAAGTVDCGQGARRAGNPPRDRDASHTVGFCLLLGFFFV